MKQCFIFFILLIFTYRIYNITDNYYHTTDSLPNNFNAIGIINNGTFSMNEYKESLIKVDLLPITTQDPTSDRIYNKQPFINSLISVPYFYIYNYFYPVTYHNPETVVFNREIYQIIGKKFASLITALSVSILYLAVFQLYKNSFLSIFIALVYAFGSFAYGTSSQANGTHHTSALLISLCFLSVVRFHLTNKSKYLALLGIFSVTAYMIRPSSIILLIGTLVIILFSRHRNKIFLILLPAALIIIIYNVFLLVNHIPFGVSTEISDSLKNINPIYSLKVLATILFSPNRGLFIFYPIFLLSFIGLFALFKKSNYDPILIFSTILVIGTLGLNSIWWAWWGGYCWGSRMLTEASIPLSFLLAYYFTEIKPKWPMKTVAILLFIYSIGVNLIGIYINDLSWDSKYLNSGRFSDVWDKKKFILSYYLDQNTYNTVKMHISDDSLYTINRAYEYSSMERSFLLKSETKINYRP